MNDKTQEVAEPTNKKCKNCGNNTHHNFCSFCGQKTSVEALTIKRLAREFSDNVFQVNRGLFFSIKELTLRPAASIDNYLKGMRKQYFQPIAYAFTLATLYFILTKLIGHSTFVDQVFEGYMLSVEASNSSMGQNGIDFFKWFSSNYAYTTILLVPLFSVATRIAFLNSKRNYLEHLVLNLYVTGHQSIIYAFSALLGLLVNHEDLMETFTLICSVSYAVFVLCTFFKAKHVIVRILQALFSYLLALIFLIFVIGAVAILD